MKAVDKLYTVLLNTEIPVFYVSVPEKQLYPYILYTSYAKSYTRADDRIDDTTVYIQVDFYTQEAFDGKDEKIEAALDAAGWPFEYNYFYEAEKKLHHHVFDVSIEENRHEN